MYNEIIFPHTNSISNDLEALRRNHVENNGGNIRKMKATGIVRRIDDLGRVVVPKEIRRTLRYKNRFPAGQGQDYPLQRLQALKAENTGVSFAGGRPLPHPADPHAGS